MTVKETKVFSPADRQEWREWLQENHSRGSSVWLIYHKKSSQLSTITWSEAVDEALCFGWIDSLARPLDAERYMRFSVKESPAVSEATRLSGLFILLKLVQTKRIVSKIQ